MLKLKTILLVGVLALAAPAGWRVGMSEFANLELQEDLHDLSAQIGAHIGYHSPQTDDQFREAVIRKAREHDIDLDPSQVTVQRSGSDASPAMYLAADYSVPVTLPGYSFELHFTPSSTKKSF